MKRELTYEDAVLGLKRAVEFKGADYVYERVGASEAQVGQCLNWYAGQPSCIVGHVLVSEVGIDPTSEEARHCAPTAVWTLFDRLDVRADVRTRRLLGAVQMEQDNGRPWGDSVDYALAMDAVESEVYK